MTGRLAVAVLAVAVTVAACRTVPLAPQAGEQPWSARRAQLQARTTFTLTARVAVATGQDGFNARLRWVQSGSRSRLELSGPLGVGGMQVSADGAALSVTTAHGEHLDDSAARAELTARLGFEPPIANLRYWILGAPAPGAPAQESLGPERRLATLQQDGWSIEYGNYTSVKGDWLPAKLTLQRAAVRVRVIVDDWS